MWPAAKRKFLAAQALLLLPNSRSIVRAAAVPRVAVGAGKISLAGLSSPDPRKAPAASEADWGQAGGCFAPDPGTPLETNENPNRPLTHKWPPVTELSAGEVTRTIWLACTRSVRVQPTPQ